MEISTIIITTVVLGTIYLAYQLFTMYQLRQWRRFVRDRINRSFYTPSFKLKRLGSTLSPVVYVPLDQTQAQPKLEVRLYVETTTCLVALTTLDGEEVLLVDPATSPRFSKKLAKSIIHQEVHRLRHWVDKKMTEEQKEWYNLIAGSKYYSNNKLYLENSDDELTNATPEDIYRNVQLPMVRS